MSLFFSLILFIETISMIMILREVRREGHIQNDLYVWDIKKHGKETTNAPKTIATENWSLAGRKSLQLERRGKNEGRGH